MDSPSAVTFSSKKQELQSLSISDEVLGECSPSSEDDEDGGEVETTSGEVEMTCYEEQNLCCPPNADTWFSGYSDRLGVHGPGFESPHGDGFESPHLFPLPSRSGRTGAPREPVTDDLLRVELMMGTQESCSSRTVRSC